MEQEFNQCQCSEETSFQAGAVLCMIIKVNYLKHSNKTVTLNYANFTSCNVHFKLSFVWVITFILADIDECGERNGLCGGVCVNEETDHRCTCMAGTTLAQDGFNCGGRALKGVHKLCYVFMHLSL